MPTKRKIKVLFGLVLLTVWAAAIVRQMVMPSYHSPSGGFSVLRSVWWCNTSGLGISSDFRFYGLPVLIDLEQYLPGQGSRTVLLNPHQQCRLHLFDVGHRFANLNASVLDLESPSFGRHDFKILFHDGDCSLVGGPTGELFPVGGLPAGRTNLDKWVVSGCAPDVTLWVESGALIYQGERIYEFRDGVSSDKLLRFLQE